MKNLKDFSLNLFEEKLCYDYYCFTFPHVPENFETMLQTNTRKFYHKEAECKSITV